MADAPEEKPRRSSKRRPAKRAGHSVDVLRRGYAKCMDGQQGR